MVWGFILLDTAEFSGINLINQYRKPYKGEPHKAIFGPDSFNWQLSPKDFKTFIVEYLDDNRLDTTDLVVMQSTLDYQDLVDHLEEIGNNYHHGIYRVRVTKVFEGDIKHSFKFTFIISTDISSVDTIYGKDTPTTRELYSLETIIL